ncbi:MAG TPA: DNA primase [bacterium]|nr:DNA primase [bacterium]
MTGRSRDVTDEIRRRVNILEVVSSHVTLRRAGRNYKGLCPFHSEKTPSFTVDPERGFFYCFGCHAGGDVFDFVMRIGGMPFNEARRELAERAGIHLEEGPEGEHRAGERERLLRAVAEAAGFFRAQLAGDPGRAAREYLASRGVTADLADLFAIGYAPAAWDHLLRALRSRGFEAEGLEQAGLVVAKQGGEGHYDAFRDRIIFPIRDLQGRPVAFGGRALDDATPKYLNSRETPLFAKGKTLYALDVARAAIRESGEAVVVEGYMDAVACHQFGFRGAVASLGTALTADQVLLLKRFAARAVLIYDADAGGADAAARGSALFDQAGLPVRVAVLPAGDDPDSFLRARGPEAFEDAVRGAVPIFEYRLAIAMERHDPKTVEGKVGIVDEMGQLLTMGLNPVRQAEYVRMLSEQLGVREEAIRDELRRLGQREQARRPAQAATATPIPETRGRAAAEGLVLHLLVSDAALRESARGTVVPEMFREAGHRALAEALLSLEASGDDLGRLRERLRDETAISLLSRFLIAEPPAGDHSKMAKMMELCLRRIRQTDLQGRVHDLLSQLNDASAARDQTKVELLQGQLQEVYRELKVSV